MAEQIISPGVFTRENDLSFLPQGVGQIGAAVIGPTVKGPAFVPTVVRSFTEYERKFGSLSPDTFVPQTVREYLKNAGSVTVCRVLAGGGYTFDQDGTNQFIVIGASGSDHDFMAGIDPATGLATTDGHVARNMLLGVIFPSKYEGADAPDLSVSALANATSMSADFVLHLSGTQGGSNLTQAGGTAFSASINSANQNYLFKQLGDDPNNSKSAVTTYNGTPGYTYVNFKQLQTDILGATTSEVATLTFSTTQLSTQSLHTASLAASGAIFIATQDGNINTIKFTAAGSDPTLGAVPTATSGFSGSITTVAVLSHNMTTGVLETDGVSSVSSSVLAHSSSVAINALAGLSASLSNDANGNPTIVTITAIEAGSSLDLSTSYPSTIATMATTTQGADAPSGYTGFNASSEIILANQSADVVFNGNGLGKTEGYSYASTPLITSQFLDNNKSTKELFQFHSLVHGTSTNKDYKVSIASLKEPADIDGVEQYSTFTVLIRKYNDTDKNPVILEQFNNCNLDPDSPNFISRVIGDRYPDYNETLDKVELLGNYPNKSNYCRVQVTEPVAARALSPKLSPKGFKAVVNPIATASLAAGVGDMIFPSCSFEGVQQTGTDDTYSSKGFLGWKFNEKDVANDNWIRPLPSTQESNISGEFNVENYSGHASSSLWSGSLSASVTTTGDSGPTAGQLKFTIPFQGGDDGIAPYQVIFTGAESSLHGNYTAGDNLFGFDVSETGKAGYKGYKKAIDILANQDEYDINMLVIPGAIKQYHPLVTNKGIDMVEERGDAFYVMDLAGKDTKILDAVGEVSGLDTNYAAVYFPWVRVLDSARNKPILVPPSVIVPGAIAASDRIGAEWFAPAGLNRGILGNVLEAKIRLNQAERDALYDNKINPIATFPQTGVCIWGQKTLQERSTALNRINVRRLLIALKKFIASSSRYLVFEQNTVATRNRFLNIVNPYLESVQQRQGLYAFRVQMDESNNTPDVIDRNQLVGAIYIQPAKTAEFIVLDFNILPTGATFDTAGGAGGGY